MGTHFQQLIDDSGTIWNLLFQIFCILLPAIFVLGKAVHFLWKGGTPKYYFWKPLRIILYVHLFLGATEYVLFFTRFFVSSTTLSYVLASVNILHSISIVGMCIGVSGERYWMIPTYFWVIVIKLYYSGALFASPDSFTIFMAMFYLHSFFAWGRLFFIVMSATYLFESCAYSMSSNLGVVVSLSQALGQSNDYQFITIFFLLIMGTAIIFQITKPRFIVDNDQTNDSLFNMFTAEQIDTVIGEFKKIDDQSGSTGSTGNHVESAGSQSETTMANMMDVEQQSSSKENTYLSKFKVLIRVLFDGNDDGSITVREFAEVFCQKMGFDMHITENVWECFDKERKGNISVDAAAQLFSKDNPHTSIDYFMDKLQAVMLQIHQKRLKKEEIALSRSEKLNADIERLEKKYE